jgi:hypothetical protein
MIQIMKEKASKSNMLQGPAGLMFILGAESGDFRCLLGAHGRGSDPLQLHLLKFLPASGCTRPRGMSSGMSRRQGLKPAVILALWPEESKGQNDLFKLLYFE